MVPEEVTQYCVVLGSEFNPGGIWLVLHPVDRPAFLGQTDVIVIGAGNNFIEQFVVGPEATWKYTRTLIFLTT